MATIFDKSKFMEQYVVNYMAASEIAGLRSQMGGRPVIVAMIGVATALKLADTAWEALEELKRNKEMVDKHSELQFMFEPPQNTYDD